MLADVGAQARLRSDKQAMTVHSASGTDLSFRCHIDPIGLKGKRMIHKVGIGQHQFIIAAAFLL